MLLHMTEVHAQVKNGYQNLIENPTFSPSSALAFLIHPLHLSHLVVPL